MAAGRPLPAQASLRALFAAAFGGRVFAAVRLAVAVPAVFGGRPGRRHRPALAAAGLGGGFAVDLAADLAAGLAESPRTRPSPALFLEAALERLHQVDHFAAAGLGRRDAEGLLGVQRLPLLQLRLDELAQLELVVVGELVRLEVGCHRVHQRGGHLPFLRGDPDGGLERGEAGLAHLVGPQQRLQHQDLAADPQRTQPGLVPQRELDDRHPVRVLQRPAQQHIGLGRLGVGLKVVALLEHHRVELLGRHELHDVDLVAVLGRDGLQLVAAQDHRAAVVLVGLVDVLVVHDLAADLAAALVADPAAVGVVDLVEADVVVLGRAVDLDGHVDQPERYCAFPDGSHGSSEHHSCAEVKPFA